MRTHLTIVITDTSGHRRSFHVDRATLECGAGCLELRSAHPAYCRKFDDAVLRIIEPAGEPAFVLHHGTAALTTSALCIVCEKFKEAAESDWSSVLVPFPAQGPESHKPAINPKQQTV